jgi:hypothetical protein
MRLLALISITPSLNATMIVVMLGCFGLCALLTSLSPLGFVRR